MLVKRYLSLFIALLFSATLFAQTNNIPKHEVRGVWIASVTNLDWPSNRNAPVSSQQEELIDKLDKLKAAGINLVFFQVRTEGDALYDSDIEPWSQYLTGEEGKAPDPYWDPLEFAINEAHKRGMELHAWLNPYRAMRVVPSDFTQKQNSTVDESLIPILNKEYDVEGIQYKMDTAYRDSMHVSNTNPEWLLVVNNYAFFDPGLPEVIEHNIRIVMDIVNRYDVDGIHFDDYFYPYPPNHMSSSSDFDALDDSTFAKYPRGFTNKGDWRRNNINIFVEALNDSIQTTKPWVKLGISPFGIWKSGTPSGISGMNAYSTIYADGLAWLEAQSIDYITPQLYWPFDYYGMNQDYGKLSNWWAEQAANNDRHIYPGHGLYRTDSGTFSGTLFSANEIPRQIRHNRENEHIDGSVFFRTKNITTYSSKGFADSLKSNYYKYTALPPVLDWKDTTKPAAPSNLLLEIDEEQGNRITLRWDRPSAETAAKNSISAHSDTLIKYAIYRVDSSSDPSEIEEMQKAENLIAVTGETTYTDIAEPSSTDRYYYFVTAVTRNNVESEPTPSQDAGVVVSNSEESQIANDFTLSQNYPNPFNPTTEIKFNLKNSGFASLVVYDILGREVAILIHENLPSGSHSISFNASDLSSGIYIYQLKIDNASLTKRMTLIK